jgi:hypothetical protein
LSSLNELSSIFGNNIEDDHPGAFGWKPISAGVRRWVVAALLEK